MVFVLQNKLNQALAAWVMSRINSLLVLVFSWKSNEFLLKVLEFKTVSDSARYGDSILI